METILGLLLILLPAIFKLVEKKLNASGKTDAAEAMHEWSEIFGKEEDGDVPEEMKSVKMRPEHSVSQSEPVHKKPAQHDVAHVKAKASVSKPELGNEDIKKKEKIDPKKLVIYSEIMKPKF